MHVKSVMHRLVWSLLLILCVQPLCADDADVSAPAAVRKIAQANKERTGKQKPVIADAKAEADVLEFVREHHPELADLLSQLKENHPKEYQKAVQDLSRVRQRLQMMQKNDDRRYELELNVWKVETRVQLLAARLHMGPSEELREQLRAALGEQIDLRLELLHHEREQAKLRVEKLDAQIKRTDADRSQAIERQLKMLTAKSAAKNTAKPGSGKPAAKTSSDKPAKEPSKKS